MMTNRVFEVHPLAEIWPVMPSNELEQLAENIKLNGLLRPITVWKNKVIDGRNRLKACEMAGVTPDYNEPEIEISSDEGLLVYLDGLNQSRRHASKSQMACIAYLALDRLDAMKHGKKVKTREVYAMRFNVNAKYIAMACDLYVKKPDIFWAVHRGEVDIMEAAKAVAGAPVEKKEKIKVKIEGLRMDVGVFEVGEDETAVLKLPVDQARKLMTHKDKIGVLTFTYDEE